MNILAVIPARGGSKGIPRKNVRLLNNQPLISYTIQKALASSHDLDVCVSTDDLEIAQIARNYGAKVMNRDSQLAQDAVTLDPVIYDAYQRMEAQENQSYDLIVTLQPTSPLLEVETLDQAISKIINEESIDSIISVVNDPHLAWKEEKGSIVPAYEKRLNRQELPNHYVETGAFLITRKSSISKDSRLGETVDVFVVNEEESVDIDTIQDWWLAEKEISKKNILIRVEGNRQIGLGHIYRGLALGYNLIDHSFHFVVSESSDIGIEKLAKSFFPYTVIQSDQDVIDIIHEKEIDIMVNDMLDTDRDYIQKLKDTGVRVVNFEDLGPGADLADAVVNDLYMQNNRGDHFYWGSDYYIIRDEFVLTPDITFKEKVDKVLVIFGGVDPSNLTYKVMENLKEIQHIDGVNFTFVIGPGYQWSEDLKALAKDLPFDVEILQDVQAMAQVMKDADLAVSSQGRTMLELASLAIPTVLLAQNKRELTHEFGYLENGFINLGLGAKLDGTTIAKTLSWLIETPQIRQQMHEQMKASDLTNGMKRVLSIILDEPRPH